MSPHVVPANAGTHTPRIFNWNETLQQSCVSREHGGYGSRRSPGRPVERAALLLLVLLAPDRLQLGEHRVDIEVVALLFGRLEFRLLARGSLRRRQQRGAAVGLVGRLFLG